MGLSLKDLYQLVEEEIDAGRIAQEALTKAQSRQRDQCRITELIAAEVARMNQALINGEPFDPHDLELWDALTYSRPSEANRQQAKNLRTYIKEHIGSMVVYDYEHGWGPPIHMRVGTIDEQGLMVMNR
ncbi:MAG: hypothetical protein ABIH34_03685, partial [Nanoarchaeota archaeon]